MNKTINIASILVMLLLATAILPIVPVSGDSRAYETHAGIVIASDADFTTANGVRSGTGTAQDPYIISGWELSATLANGISIQGTSKHFKVSGCKITGTTGVGVGIALQNVKNGKVETTVFDQLANGISANDVQTTEIYSNTFTGSSNPISINTGVNLKIYKNTFTSAATALSFVKVTASNIYDNQIAAASGISMSGQANGNDFYHNNFTSGGSGITYNDVKDNKIHNNMFKDITGYAITAGSSSSGNLIYFNDFKNNNGGTKQAMSATTTDVWYNTTASKGNYWSDWTTPDANSDGVVDTAYAIGGNTAQDNFPLTQPIAYSTGSVTPPLAVTLSADKTTGTAPLLVTFTAAVTGGTSPYTYNYTFGDGIFSTAPTHTYGGGGTFQASVTVKDSKGATKTSNTVSLTIIAPLNVTISATTTTGKAPLAVGFTPTVKGGVAPYNYSWDFGDGTTKSTDKEPAHVFKKTGMYTVKLTVTDSKGTTKSETKTIIAVKAPTKPAGFIPGFETLVLVIAVLAAVVLVGRRKN